MLHCQSPTFAFLYQPRLSHSCFLFPAYLRHITNIKTDLHHNNNMTVGSLDSRSPISANYRRIHARLCSCRIQ